MALDKVQKYMLDQDVQYEFVKLEEAKVDIDKLKKKTDWINVKDFGATGDGVSNDLASVKSAIATLQDGDTLYFPRGTYILTGETLPIAVTNIKLKGNGLLKMDYGFRPSESGFTVDGLRFEATAYSTSARAIQVDIPPSGKIVRNFVVRNCSFKNFFYACRFAGGDYNVTGNEATEGFPVRDVVIENCYSETYSTSNAGHFQVIQVENVSYLNNRTYGGQNATSYNAIKGNGYIKIIGNYDDNNSYGSCEIENASGKVAIQGNTFKKAIWVDDSYSVVVDGNFTDDVIRVTVGSNNGNADNVIVSNNICKQIRAESFGTYLGGKVNYLLISDNTVNGTGTYGIFIDGKYTGFVLVDNNVISGTYDTGKIGVIRGDSCEVLLRRNIVKGSVVISSTGGLVYAEQNLGAAYNGARDTLVY